jgi:hypothetical protein
MEVNYMVMEIAQDIEKYVVPVEIIPPVTRNARGFYDRILNSVLASERNKFKVTIPEKKKIDGIYSTLWGRAKEYNKNPNRKYTLAVVVRNKEVYIAKVDPNINQNQAVDSV